MTGHHKAHKRLLFWFFLGISAIVVGVTSLIFVTDIGSKVAFLVSAVLSLGLSLTHIRAALSARPETRDR